MWKANNVTKKKFEGVPLMKPEDLMDIRLTVDVSDLKARYWVIDGTSVIKSGDDKGYLAGWVEGCGNETAKIIDAWDLTGRKEYTNRGYLGSDR